MSLKKIFIASLMVSGLLFTMQSCEKIEDFGDLNRNPGQTADPVPSALLANVISDMGNYLVWDQGGLNTVAGLYAQYFSETQYTDASRYSTPNFNWDVYYAGGSDASGKPVAGPLIDLQSIINYNSNPETAERARTYGANHNQIAIARILKAHYFKFLTDAYGDLPYFEALKGVSILSYDKQEDIYKDILKELKEAVDQLAPDATFPVRGDLLFNGDVNAWKRYGNSLRLLTALMLSERNPTLGKQEFQAALSHPAGVIETNAQNVDVEYPGGNFPNPFYRYYNITQRFDYALSATVVSALTSRGDNRIDAFAENPKGFPYGLTREDAIAWANANGGYSLIFPDAYNSNDASPIVVIGAANVWLARAEAAVRGWTSEDAAMAFKTGIQRSWEQWNVYNDTEFNEYLNTIGATPTVEKVAIQEWLAWFPNGMEGWNVWRRTGFPNLTPAPGTNAIPRRFPYGPNEFNLNPQNAQAAAAQYNNNSQFARLWWDQD